MDAALSLDAAMADDPEMIAEVMGEIFADIALDASMDVSFSDDLVELIETEGDLAWPENVLLNLRLVDGNGFLDVDALTQSVPELGRAASGGGERLGWRRGGAACASGDHGIGRATRICRRRSTAPP